MRDKDKGICRIVAILIVVTIGTSCVLPLIGNATGQGTWKKIWGPAGTVVDCNSSEEFVPADQQFLVYATNRSTGDIYEYKYKPVVATMQWTKLPEMPGRPTLRIKPRDEWPYPTWVHYFLPEEEQKPYGPMIACDRIDLYATYPGGDAVYTYSDVGAWDNLGGPANITSICAGDGNGLLYAINKSGIYSLSYDMSQSPQSQWEKIGDGPRRETAAGSGPTDPKLYATYPDSAGVFRFGILGLHYPALPWARYMWTYGAGEWTYIGGPVPIARIYAGGHELFATNYDNDTGDIYHYTFVPPPYPHQPHFAPGVWTKLPYMSPPPEEEPYYPKFAVDDEGVLFGLDKTGIYRWDSTSKQWTKIGVPAADIYANIHGRLYATDLVTHDLWCWS